MFAWGMRQGWLKGLLVATLVLLFAGGCAGSSQQEEQEEGQRSQSDLDAALEKSFEESGAPQKIMYLADDYWRSKGVRERTKITFATPSNRFFGIEAYASTINQVVKRKNIEGRFGHSLVEIRPDEKEAVFSVERESKEGDEVVTEESREILPYDLLHVVPPMSAPDS